MAPYPCDGVAGISTVARVVPQASTGDDPGPLPRLSVIGDTREQPAHLDRGREFAALRVRSLNRGGVGFGDNDRHHRRMGIGAIARKRWAGKGVAFPFRPWPRRVVGPRARGYSANY